MSDLGTRTGSGPAGSGAHPSVEEIADLHAGLGEGDPHLAADDAHVRSCDRCSQVLAALDATVADSRALPDVAVPDDVRVRVDSALQHADAGDTPQTTAAGAPGESPATAVPAAPAAVIPLAPRRARRLPSAAGAVAASVVVLLVAALGIGVLSRGEDSRTSSGGGADTATSAQGRRDGAPALAGKRQVASGANYSRTGLTAAVPTLLGIKPGRQSGTKAGTGGTGGAGSAENGQQTAAPSAQPAPRATGPVTTLSTGEPAAAGADRSADAAIPAPLTALRDQPGRLEGCLAELTGRPPLFGYVVDYARYDGRPAAVVVVDSLQAGKLDVWVVGPGCRAGAADLRLYQAVDRPQGR